MQNTYPIKIFSERYNVIKKETNYADNRNIVIECPGDGMVPKHSMEVTQEDFDIILELGISTFQLTEHIRKRDE